MIITKIFQDFEIIFLILEINNENLHKVTNL